MAILLVLGITDQRMMSTLKKERVGQWGFFRIMIIGHVMTTRNRETQKEGACIKEGGTVE